MATWDGGRAVSPRPIRPADQAQVREYSIAKAERIQADPCSSYWLQEAVRVCMQRDCLDALVDAEALVSLLRLRCSEEGLT